MKIKTLAYPHAADTQGLSTIITITILPRQAGFRQLRRCTYCLWHVNYSFFNNIVYTTALFSGCKAFYSESCQAIIKIPRDSLSGKFYSATFNGLTLIPGPIVVVTTTLFIYWPLAATGFALTMASISVRKLSCNFSRSKDALPIGQ